MVKAGSDSMGAIKGIERIAEAEAIVKTSPWKIGPTIAYEPLATAPKARLKVT